MKDLYALSLAACRKKIDKHTRLIHLFEGKEGRGTIPLYENFVFALALFRQKSVEGALEAKEVVGRLLPFQNGDGEFPRYLHDYPRAFSPLHGLQIALAMRLLLEMPLGEALSLRVKKSLDLLLKALEGRELSYTWRRRLAVLQGKEPPPLQRAESLLLWEEEVLTEQLLQKKVDLSIFVGGDLSLFPFFPGDREYEGNRLLPHVLELVAAFSNGAEVKGDDIPFIYAALFDPIAPWEKEKRPFFYAADQKGSYVAFGDSSFWIEGGDVVKKGEMIEIQSDQRVVLYATHGEGRVFAINGKRGTLFHPGDILSYQAKELSWRIAWEMEKGRGVGRIERGNRPQQRKEGAFDYRIVFQPLAEGGAFKLALSMAIPIA